MTGAEVAFYAAIGYLAGYSASESLKAAWRLAKPHACRAWHWARRTWCDQFHREQRYRFIRVVYTIHNARYSDATAKLQYRCGRCGVVREEKAQ